MWKILECMNNFKFWFSDYSELITDGFFVDVDTDTQIELCKSLMSFITSNLFLWLSRIDLTVRSLLASALILQQLL